MGSSWRYFNVIISETGLSFDLYLTMGYGASATNLTRLTPKYYNPEFNRKAAWKVEVIPPEGDDPPEMGNTWANGDTTTPYTVTVKVYDWQHDATVDSWRWAVRGLLGAL